MKKITCFFATALFCFAFFSTRCFASPAKVVSFQIIQHDNAQTDIRASSYVIENTLFDYFFDKGIIVTNSPTAISADDLDDKIICDASLSQASNGGCTHFIMITADYDVARSVNPAALILSNIERISWKLFDVKTGAQIAFGTKTVGTVPERKNNENGIVSFTKELAGELYAHLQSNAQQKGK